MLKTKKNKFLYTSLLTFLLLSNLFWIGGVIVNFKFTAYKEIRKTGRLIKEGIKKIAEKPVKTKEKKESRKDILETSVLPLSKNAIFFDQSKFKYKKLLHADGMIYIIDSLGNSLSFDGHTISEIPNQLNHLGEKNEIATYLINKEGHEEIKLEDEFSTELDKNNQLSLFVFVPPVGITSIIKLDRFHERWDGDLLIASSEMQSLYRLKLEQGRVIFNEPIWVGHPITDMVQFKNNIVLLSENNQLVVLNVDKMTLERNVKGNNMMAILPSLAKCTSCHQFTPTTPISMAPSLKNIFNKKIGSDPLFKRYTVAIKEFKGTWDENNLRSYLENPSAFIPGTAMPAMELTDDELDEIVSTLSNPLRK